MAAGVHSRAPAALRAFHHSMPMTSPFLLRSFLDDATAIAGCPTLEAAQAAAQQLLSGEFQGTVEIWRYLPEEQLYALEVGYDRLFEPTVYTYDASMMAEDAELVRWNGEAGTYLYQPETF